MRDGGNNILKIKHFGKIIITITLISIFLSCSVNERTGVIKVDNRTLMELKDLKIGERLIVGYLSAGGYYDYWYYAPINGVLTSSNFQPKSKLKDKELELKPAMWVNITAKYDNEKNQILEVSAEYHDSEEVVNEVWK